MSQPNGFQSYSSASEKKNMKEDKASNIYTKPNVGCSDAKELSLKIGQTLGEKHYKNLQDFMLDVAQKLGQWRSFYVLNMADVLWKVQKWKEMLPNVEMFYAVKANPDPILLRLLVLLGLSFDCATEGEIEMLLQAGAPASTLLWAHTIKTVEGLNYARGLGVDTMTFDNEDELRKIHEVYPDSRLLLRVRPSLVKCRFDLSSKFGCDFAEAPTLLKLAKKLGMKVEGISFHVGALCTDPDSFCSTIRECRTIFDEAKVIGYDLTILDIGGGFFGATGTEHIFAKITKGINQSLEKYFPTGVRIIAEPGCYVVGSALQLVCTILGKRDTTRQGDIQRHYFLNNGIYGSFFRDIESYGIQVRPLLDESELKSRKVYKSALYGQTCCSEDVISQCCPLPDLEIGECLVWNNMGAYSSPLCSTFCGVPLPHTSYVFEQNSSLNMEDIFAKDEVAKLLEKQAVFIGFQREKL